MYFDKPTKAEEDRSHGGADRIEERRREGETRKELEQRNGFGALCSQDDVINLIYTCACFKRTRTVPLFGAHLVSVGAGASASENASENANANANANARMRA